MKSLIFMLFLSLLLSGCSGNTAMDAAANNDGTSDSELSNLHSSRPQISTSGDLSRYLGAPVTQFVNDSTPDSTNEPDRGLARFSSDATPLDLSVWRRISLPISWQNGEITTTKRLTVGYRTDTDEIWYVQAPLLPGGNLSIGPIATNVTFHDCVRLLGEPHHSVARAPIIRRAWWTIAKINYRVDYFTEEYQDRQDGEIDWIAAYRDDLAPNGFDDGYAFFNSLLER